MRGKTKLKLSSASVVPCISTVKCLNSARSLFSGSLQPIISRLINQFHYTLITMFSVVYFEDGLQVVPSLWLSSDEKECSWPSATINQIKLNKMIAAQNVPEGSWDRIKVVRVFRKTETYTKAIQILKLCMDISDVDTASSGEEKIRRRKLKVRPISNSEEEIDISKLPKFPNPPKKMRALGEFSKKLPSKGQVLSVEEDNLQEKVTEQDDTSLSSICKCNETKSTPAETKINELILGKVNFLINCINILEEKVDLLRVAASIDSSASSSSDIMKRFPLKVDEELIVLEKFISDEENRKNLVINLKKIGGSDEYHVVTNILKRVLSNEVAELYSLVGAKKKKIFKTLHLTTAIIETTRMHFPSVTEHAVGNYIANWLRHAKQRKDRADGIASMKTANCVEGN